MTPLYLTGFEIDEFRSFGRLQVTLPSGPGVMIVHGSNGLGKSSLFDGLEWALTGEVNHFPKGKALANGDYLRRFDAAPRRPTRIRLDFNEGWLARTLDGGLDPEGERDIAAFLRNAGWKRPISHLGRYLLLAHFLGQSTSSRMTHRNDKDRWTYLQEPAQSDRALELVKALHGHGSSTPARAFEKKARALAQEAETIAKLLVQEEDHWHDSRLEGAIDDSVAPAEAAAIVNEVAAIDRLAGPVDPPHITLADAPAILAAFLTHTTDLVRRRKSAIERAGQLLADEQAAAITRAELRGALAEARGQEAAAAPLVATAIERFAATELAHIKSQDALAEARKATAALSRIKDMRQRAAETAQALGQARSLAAAVHEQIPAAETRVGRAQKRRDLTDWLAERERAANEEIRRIAQHREDLDGARQALARKGEAQHHYDALVARHSNLAADIGAANASLEDLIAKERAARAARDAVKESGDALAAAVAAVAAHTADDACECPVCGSVFAPSELPRRMAEASERLAPALVPLETMLSEATRARMTGERIALDLNDAKTALDLASADLRMQSDAFTAASAGAAAVESASDELLAAMVAHTEDRRLSAEFRRRRARYWIGHPIVGGAQGALAEWTDAAAQRNDIVRSAETHDRTADDLSVRLDGAMTALRNAAVAAGLAPDVGDSEFVAEQTRREAREREALTDHDRTKAELQTADAALGVARAAYGAAAARVEELARQDKARENEASQRQSEWEDLGTGVVPFDGVALGDATAAIVAIGPKIERAQERVEAFQKGRLAAARLVRHGQALSDLGKAAGTAPAADRAAVRERAAGKQRALLNRAARVQLARDIAYETTQDVGQRVEYFNKQFLQPLSDLMNDLNCAILTDRDIGLDFDAGKNEVGQRTRTGDKTPENVAKLNPLYIHSEGQMAALAVSMLTAANLSFPWSRWRALVMDDPLQHNDAIHSAAFADMTRNLILEHGYQLFLTTHELAEAQFLRRKFEAAQIPCTMIHLTGRGENGVENRVEAPPTRTAAVA